MILMKILNCNTAAGKVFLVFFANLLKSLDSLRLTRVNLVLREKERKENIA